MTHSICMAVACLLPSGREMWFLERSILLSGIAATTRSTENRKNKVQLDSRSWCWLTGEPWKMLHILSMHLSERKTQGLHPPRMGIVLDCNWYPSTKEEGCWKPREQTHPFPASGLAKAQEAAQRVWSKQVSLKLHQIYCSKWVHEPRWLALPFVMD